MSTKKFAELKEGDIIIVYGDECLVKKVELAGKGLKKGRKKCRIEAENMKDKKPVVLIKLAEETIEAK